MPEILEMTCGACVTVLEIVKTGTKGRWEVDVSVANVIGFKNKLGLVVVGRVVNFKGRTVVCAVVVGSEL